MKKMLSLVLVVIVVIVTTFIALSTMKVSSDNDFVRANASLVEFEGDVSDNDAEILLEILLRDYRNGEEEALNKIFRAFHSNMGPETYEYHVRMIWATQCPKNCPECDDFIAFCEEFDIK